MNWIDQARILKSKVLLAKYGWSGNFSTWAQAGEQCTGYNATEILEKVKQSTLKIKNGEAVYERDSVLFNKVEYSWPLLSALMWVAARNKGKLKVLDFGGSLGSSYFQNKFFLDTLEYIEWNVIEQHNFVECGREIIQNDKLLFHHSVEECIMARGLQDILIISCTLPYVENPYFLLEQLLQNQIPYIIIDNTYFNYKNEDRICIQKIPTNIYSASYPCWFLDYNKVLKVVNAHYSVVSEHNNDSVIYLDGRKIQYKGLIAKHNKLQ